MFKIPPLASRANWVYENIPWQEVGQISLENTVSDGRNIRVRGTEALHFGNVSYLGLDTDERLKAAAIEAIGRHGVQFSSSRSFLQLSLYDELEHLLGQMFGGRPVVVTPTTSLAHQAAMPIFMLPEDAVLIDYQAHASLQLSLEIVRSKGAHIEYLPHNDLERLDQRLAELSLTHERVWYIADGVYSMFGDTGPMEAIADLMHRHENMHLYIDDAHGMSWAGANGTGLVCSRFAPDERTLLITSLNKGFAAGGGAIVCPNEQVKTWLRRCGSSLIFSGPLQPSALAAGIESAKIHLSPEVSERQQKVQANIRCFLETARSLNIILADASETPIFFVGAGRQPTAAKLCQRLREAGFFTNLGIFPAVPLNQTGLRISLNCHLTADDIRKMLHTLAELWAMILAEEKSTPEKVFQVFSRRAGHSVVRTNP